MCISETIRNLKWNQNRLTKFKLTLNYSQNVSINNNLWSQDAIDNFLKEMDCDFKITAARNAVKFFKKSFLIQ